MFGIDILAFGLKNWKAILVGLVFAAFATYTGVVVLERNHYKSEYADTKLALDTLVKNSKAREESLQTDVDAITTKYASAHGAATTLALESARINQEGIARDKELAAVRLSLNAVRMFNASKQPAAVEATAAATVSVDAGEAGAAATAAPEVTPSAFTLQDLLAQSARNDAAHLSCVQQVEDWQNFWSDYTAAVAASEAQP